MKIIENGIIPIYENIKGKAVNARDLHEFLEVGKDFTTWIKDRIEKYGFTENDDYIIFTENGENPGRPKMEYIFTLDIAKEIAMVQNNEKGSQARRYFIEIEKKFKKISEPVIDSTFLFQIAAQLQEKEKMISLLKPKAEFYDDVAGSKDAIEISKAAKVLDMGIGRNKLFEILRNKKILQYDNIPYQTYIDRGYFRTIEQKWTTPDGETKINIKTLVYQRGLDYIRKMLKAV
jgi:anti-repressor protein